MSKINKQKGFTLIELIVSASVFSVVVLISTGSIFTIFDSNRKSQNLRSAMDNFNLSMESMTRTIRFGYNYHCDINIAPFTSPLDCPNNTSTNSSLAVQTSPSSRVLYRLNSNRIETSKTDGATWSPITSSDVTITSLNIRVIGSLPYSNASASACPTGGQADRCQPKVIIVVRGYVGAKVSSRTSFNLQTTVSQRNFDSQ